MQPPSAPSEAPAAHPRDDGGVPRRVWRLALVVLGIYFGQFVLYGPSLIGVKILLPLDVLTAPGVYLPQTPETSKVEIHDAILSDLVQQQEMLRIFSADELRAGRLPAWLPYEYAGVPIAWPKYSPFLLLAYSTRSPHVLAWVQLVSALVAGLGMYAFCRRVLQVSFWSAVVPAWCFPLTGFLILSQGYPSCGAIYWLPWLFLAVGRAVRRPDGFHFGALAAVTALTLLSGQTDIVAQALLASGLYGLWSMADACGWAQVFQRRTARAATVLILGWVLGFMAASPHVLPLLDYARTGSRVQKRSAGAEERPPVGWTALPQTVLPDMNGSSRTGSIWLGGGNQIESSAAAYAGIVATLFVAPLAWCRRRQRSFFWFGLALIGLSVSWCANVPGLVWLLRLPGLNLMSHNRLVFWMSFAVLALAAAGLEALQNGEVQRRRWFLVPAGLLAVLGVWSVYRSVDLSARVAAQVTAILAQGKPLGWIKNAENVVQLREWFTRANVAAAVLCGAGLAGWMLVWFGVRWRAALVGMLAAVLLGDMLWFGYGRSAQCDPELYYPRIPALEALSRAGPTRVIGCGCLPAALSESHGLWDVRGYDAIDPDRMTQLLLLTAQPNSPSASYALVQWLVPRVNVERDGIRVSPILDMLAVRFVIFRGPPHPQVRPAVAGGDYWVAENRHAMPRIYLPLRVETIADASQRLQRLAAADFDPRLVAYVESPTDLTGAAQGSVHIVSETPTDVVTTSDMQTPGLLVLADNWDAGWKAYLNDREVPILRTNHALRGVVVPAGKSTVEFLYQPSTFILGLWLAALAASLVVIKAIWRLRRFQAV